MNALKSLSLSAALAGSMMASLPALSADYAIDVKGAHAFVQFRIKHLGYSWLYGRFNTFDGQFSWDAKQPEKSQISVDVVTKSLDTNHAERDKHIRSDDFLNVQKFPKAQFVSKKVVSTGSNTADVTGDLTLHGVTKSVTLKATFIGEGKDPWGGYRAGFQAEGTINPGDFGIPTEKKLGQTEMDLILSVEGIRK